MAVVMVMVGLEGTKQQRQEQFLQHQQPSPSFEQDAYARGTSEVQCCKLLLLLLLLPMFLTMITLVVISCSGAPDAADP